MTINDSKRLIRILIEQGIEKQNAFRIVIRMINEAHEEKLSVLTRFSYELNAEEQRRNNGNAN